MLYLFAAVFGFGRGGMQATASPLAADLFGLRSHGLIYGFLSLSYTAGAAVSPFLAGDIFDDTGSYQVAFLTCAAVGIVGIAMAIMLGPTKKSGRYGPPEMLPK